jgi:hypothetical protein
MAIVSFTKEYGTVPRAARPIRGHPLCPNFGVVFENGIYDIVNGLQGTIASDSTLVDTSVLRYPGKALKRAQASANLDILFPATTIPTSGLSIVTAIVRLSRAVADSVACCVNVTFNSGPDCYFIINDTDTNSTFWHVGTSPGSGGILQPANSLFRFDEDSIFTFTSGARGMEVYENAKLIASNGTIAVRSTTTNNFICGSFGTAPDAHKLKFLLFYFRQLRPEEVGQLNTNPFQWVDKRS